MEELDVMSLVRRSLLRRRAADIIQPLPELLHVLGALRVSFLIRERSTSIVVSGSTAVNIVGFSRLAWTSPLDSRVFRIR